MNKKSWLTGALGAVALVFAAASQAQAGIDLTFTGDAVGSSFRLDFTASPTSSDTEVTSAFDSIRASILGPVVFIASGKTFVISSPSRFEDNDTGGGDNEPTDHKGIVAFDFDEDNDGSSTGANGWSQTSFLPGPTYGTDLTASSVNPVAAGDSLDFKLWFENELTDGAHFFIEFYNGSTFVTGYEIKRKVGSTTGSESGFESVNFTTPFVPLPASVWSGMALMGGLGLMLNRRRKLPLA